MPHFTFNALVGVHADDKETARALAEDACRSASDEDSGIAVSLSVMEPVVEPD